MARRAASIGGLIAGLLVVPAAAEAAAPTNLRVTDVRASGVTLTWTAPAGDVYGYSIVDLGNPAVNNQVGYSFTTTGDAERLTPQTTYRLAVRATFVENGSMVDSPLSRPVTVTTRADTTPPAPPSLRHSGHTATSVSLAWMSGADDVGVEEFVISNGSRTWTRPAWQQWWTDLTGLETNRTHTFTLRGRDAAGNLSAPSNPVSVAIENVPPSAPRNLRLSGGELQWDLSTDDSGAISGYRIFVDGDPFPLNTVFGPPAPLQVWDDSLMEFLPRSGTHTYTAKAFDSSGNESAPSNALSVVVP
jgi:Fibronectin type III domain